jgi:cytochrome c556
MNQTNLLSLGLFGVLAIFASTQVFAQEDVIEKRKALMRANNDAVSKSIKKAVEEKDYATIELKAKDIMGGLDAAANLFPKGSTNEKSRAHPDIWVKTDEFKKSLTNARKAAEALSKAAAAKDETEVDVKVKDLGNNREGACGECHKVFRKDFRKDS